MYERESYAFKLNKTDLSKYKIIIMHDYNLKKKA